MTTDDEGHRGRRARRAVRAAVTASVLVALVAVGLARWEQGRSEDATRACRSAVADELVAVAGSGGLMVQPVDTTRTGAAYVVRVEGWVLDDGRQVDDHRHRVRVCTATREDGHWRGDLEP